MNNGGWQRSGTPIRSQKVDKSAYRCRKRYSTRIKNPGLININLSPYPKPYPSIPSYLKPFDRMLVVLCLADALTNGAPCATDVPPNSTNRPSE